MADVAHHEALSGFAVTERQQVEQRLVLDLPSARSPRAGVQLGEADAPGLTA